MRIDMYEVGQRDVLAGALKGRSDLTRLLELAASEPAEPEPAFLDFAKIEVATTSYLRGVLVGRFSRT